MNRMDQVRRRRMLAMAIFAPVVALIVVVALVVRGASRPAAAPGAGEAPKGALTLDEVEGRLAEARRLLQQGQPGKADVILARTVEGAPGHRDARVLQAEARLGIGKFKEAHDSYEHAILIGPDEAGLRQAAGVAANIAGMVERAQEHFWRAQQLAPSNPQHPLYLGQMQRKLGLTTEAKASLLRAANLDPELSEAWGTLAAISLDENKLSIGHAHVLRARAADPGNISWRLLEAKILRRGNEPEKAVRMLMALEEDVRLGSPAIVEEIGLCFGLMGMPTEAAGVFAAAAERRPTDAGLALETARWFERAGDEERALEFAERAKGLGLADAGVMLEALSKSRTAMEHDRARRAESDDGG